MAAGVRERRTAQIVVEVHIHGPGNMRVQIGLAALVDVEEIEARIDDHQRGIIQAPMQRGCIDESRQNVGHEDTPFAK
jgi:hypothetical protein